MDISSLEGNQTGVVVVVVVVMRSAGLSHKHSRELPGSTRAG